MSRHRPSAKARRSAARLSAVQALYQIMLIDTPVERVIGEFVHFRFGAQIDGEEYVSPDPQLFADIVRGTAQRSLELDPLVGEAMNKAWSLDRVELLLKVILKSGTWELMENPLVPPGIIITEYVHVAQAFFGGREPAMVNAVLDRLAKSIRPEENTTKSSDPDLAVLSDGSAVVPEDLPGDEGASDIGDGGPASAGDDRHDGRPIE